MTTKTIRHGATAGGKPTRGYSTWKSMLARCRNPRHPDYHNYGGRGIRVTRAWHRFPAFLADMGEPSPGLSLDRIDNEKGYGPGNCRWATTGEQNRNKRGVRWAAFGPFRLTVCDWAVVFGVRPGTASVRLSRGWPFIDAVTLPRGSARPIQSGPPCPPLNLETC